MLRVLLVAGLLASLPACNRQPADRNAAVSNDAAADPTAHATAGEATKGVDRSRKGQPAPAATFHDSAGKDISLAAFKGRPVLVNLWASWCAPCVKELPTLDAVARAHKNLQLIAISQDSGPAPSVVAFLKAHGIATLQPYHDPTMAMSADLGAEVLPTSILFDAQGREVWRFVGDLDWTGAEGASLLGEAAAR